MDSYVTGEETSGDPIWNYVKCSEEKKLMENSMRDSIEVALRHIITGIVEETIEDVFTVGHDEQKKGFEKPIRNLAGKSLD